MRPCDLYTGSTSLRKALERVEHAWRDSHDEWHDKVSEKFQQQYLEPLVPDVKLALEAIGRMQQVLLDAQRDLEQ